MYRWLTIHHSKIPSQAENWKNNEALLGGGQYFRQQVPNDNYRSGRAERCVRKIYDADVSLVGSADKKRTRDHRQGQGQGGLSIEEEQEAEEEEEVLEEKEERRSRGRRKNGRALVSEQKKNEKVSVLRSVVRKVGRWGR